MSNIHGLGSSKKDDKKGMEEFSQDGKTSGTAVWRPSGGGNDPMADIIRQARGGGGGPAPQQSIGTVTLYANGFVFGEGGEFRESSDPKNAAFIQELKKGEVPQELEAEARRLWGPNVNQMGINLVDKSSETHVVPFSFAKSQGQSLQSSSSSQPSAGDLASLHPAEYKAEGDNLTAIQLMLKDRSRVRLQISNDATVAQLYQHVMFLTNERTFALAGGFPPKVVPCSSTTIKEAGLSGASVQVR